MTNITFENVDHDAFINFHDPNPSWANVKDCGNFPCTAPSNILYSLKDVTWLGDSPNQQYSEFQLIADNEGFAPYVPGCEREEVWNAYICQSSTLGIL